MARTVARVIVDALSELGVRQVFGVVGDALNPVTDAIRTTEGLEWVGCRHEEAAAFAASAQSQLTGTLGVCMGTVGPGSVHLLNGLYDAAKSRTPVLAIAGQVPLAELGSDYFQEVDNDALFSDVAVFRATITSPDQLPQLLETAVRNAPGPQGRRRADRARRHGGPGTDRATGRPASRLSQPRDAGPTSPPCGRGRGAPRPRRAGHAARRAGRARRARGRPRARRPARRADGADPEGQGGLRGRQPLPGRSDRPDRQPGAPRRRFEDARHAADARHRLPLPGLVSRRARPSSRWTPRPRTSAAGRRSRSALVGDAGLDRRGLLPLRCVRGPSARPRAPGEAPARRYDAAGSERQQARWPTRLRRQAAASAGCARKLRQPATTRIRPEALAAAVDRLAADDAIFTSDTGMATVWLSRFVRMRGTPTADRLLQPRLDGQRHAAGARAPRRLDRDRQVIAFCGDGGLTMLLGDLITAVTHDLPVKLVVFDNGRLGMVKLEQEQGGLPEFGTVLDNPDFAAVATADRACTGIRVDGSGRAGRAPSARAFAHPGPGAARRAHQPRRDRRAAEADASSRAGASPSPR